MRFCQNGIKMIRQIIECIKKLNDTANDTVNDIEMLLNDIEMLLNDIEMLLNEKRKQYRAYQSKSRAGSTPYASKSKKNRNN